MKWIRAVRTRALATGALAALTLIAYWGTLNAPFVFDDAHAIVDDPHVHEPLRRWRAILQGPRPLTTLTLAGNYAIGGLDVRSYHAFNIAIHILAGATLFGLVRSTLRLPLLRGQWGEASTGLAFTTALLWLLHPLQTETVTYTIQRGEALMGLFYLLSLYALVRGATSDACALGWYALSVAACALGMVSKEVMVSAPLVALLYDRAFLAGSWSTAGRRRWALYLAMALTWSLLALPVSIALGLDRQGGAAGGAGFGLDVVTPLEYLASQPGVILHYLRLAVWPYPLCLDYDWPIARQWPGIVWPGAVVAVIVLASLVTALRQPALGFCPSVFFLILLPTSSFVPIKDLAVEHRLYLPLAALIVAGVFASHAAFQYLFRSLGCPENLRQGAEALAVLAVAVAFSLTTVARNEVYASPVSVWRDVVDQRPENARAHTNLGQALLKANHPEEAARELQSAVHLDPKNAEAWNNLGVALRDQGDLPGAADAFLQAIRRDAGCAKAYANLGSVYGRRGDWQKAETFQRAALRIDSYDALTWDRLGTALDAQGRHTEAVNCFQQACEISPAHLKYRCDLAAALADIGRTAEARNEYDRAYDINPDWPADAERLAWRLATDPAPGRRDGVQAVRYARQACQATARPSPAFLDTLAAAYAAAGRWREAVTTAGHAFADAERRGDRQTAERLQQHLRSYRAQKPWVEPPVPPDR